MMWFLLTIGLILFSFYWFILRPANFKKDCNLNAVTATSQLKVNMILRLMILCFRDVCIRVDYKKSPVS
ncbi:MAG: hypothetical protein UV73_C0001G0202 [Candidatus Gottesmanbacteria bacterium GW2011_GWA2_43_14]|uniref:Uncharacterized protein n=1 Tax=Candidatus Gottesmanbacteria bacterium GW2011_GWA2_43_14 TaxID=1618443 RepID=A0A0G1FUM2_9BACT|nr:MAG: hypothetical protein UV73_C0001G0202 [Candidatus Gottesmanbacteria bacterium GW2011_GWA2_43_14]